MRKLFTILLSFVLVFSIVACTPTENKTTENNYMTEQITTPTLVTAAPTTVTTIAPTTIATTAQTTIATTAATTAPTTKPTTAPTTEPPTTPITEPTTTPTAPSETVHIHNWEAATCTAPKTCTDCGITEGEACGHTWEEATYATPKTCTACYATEGEPLEKPGQENYHGHIYTGGSSSKKYHYEEKCPGKNSHEITWEEVTRRKLGPCGTCVLK